LQRQATTADLLKVTARATLPVDVTLGWRVW